MVLFSLASTESRHKLEICGARYGFFNLYRESKTADARWAPPSHDGPEPSRPGIFGIASDDATALDTHLNSRSARVSSALRRRHVTTGK
jgi:hypothetical protein